MAKRAAKKSASTTAASTRTATVPAGDAGRPSPGSADHWLDAPEEHDYPAAASYLGLIAAPGVVTATVAALREAPVTLHAAKDVLRASRLPLLGTDNPHVRKDLGKIAAGTKLSPVLLVRGDGPAGTELVVADGYHRVCAGYHVDENTWVPAKLVPWADAGPAAPDAPGAEG